jgi:3',5'-cyclic AMP phosphodiesterase CpdA
MPYYHALGNHDALGWSSRRKCDPNDPEIGMKMIMDRLGMERNYYSFDAHGWHFAILDTMFEVKTDNGPTYTGKIGDEQLAWLARDLGRAGTRPKVVVMHIAAFCAIGQINGDPDTKAVTPGMVVADNKALRLILERHGVKVVLQGHSHMIEDYTFNGVTYLTSPAVSACWWSGTWMGFPYGYTHLFVKGDQLTWERPTIAWETYLEPEDSLERDRTKERAEFEAEQARLLAEERAG